MILCVFFSLLTAAVLFVSGSHPMMTFHVSSKLSERLRDERRISET